MRNRLTRHALVTGLLAALAALVVSSCATAPGDELPCPECDPDHEIRVGDRCVPVEDVEPCGPDGHAEGTGCHCFSGQSATNIAGTDYCLLPPCEPTEDDHEHR